MIDYPVVGRERFGARGTRIPYRFPMNNGEPPGATNRVSQPTTSVEFLSNSDFPGSLSPEDQRQAAELEEAGRRGVGRPTGPGDRPQHLMPSGLGNDWYLWNDHPS